MTARYAFALLGILVCSATLFGASSDKAEITEKPVASPATPWPQDEPERAANSLLSDKVLKEKRVQKLREEGYFTPEAIKKRRARRRLLEGLAEIVSVLAIFGLACIFLPVIVTALGVQKMRGGGGLERLSEDACAKLYDYFREDGEWALNNGFTLLVGAYRLRLSAGPFKIAETNLLLWRHADHATFFVSMAVLVNNAARDKVNWFGTDFSPGLSLSTSDRSDHLPEFPGSYAQSFRKASRNTLLEQHLSAVDYMTKHGAPDLPPESECFEESYRRSNIIKAHYISSLPLWSLRAAYWYFVRQRLYRNKSIETLHKSGRIRLPSDPGFRPYAATLPPSELHPGR